MSSSSVTEYYHRDYHYTYTYSHKEIRFLVEFHIHSHVHKEENANYSCLHGQIWLEYFCRKFKCEEDQGVVIQWLSKSISRRPVFWRLKNHGMRVSWSMSSRSLGMPSPFISLPTNTRKFRYSNPYSGHLLHLAFPNSFQCHDGALLEFQR